MFRPLLLFALPLLVLSPAGLAGEEPSPDLAFRYYPRLVLEYRERVERRETDERIGFEIATAHEVRRTYYFLSVSEDGCATVFADIEAGPQELLAYRVKGEDRSEEYRKERFRPGQTVSRQVRLVTFGPKTFRCEPAREEAPVYYLQEIPEVLPRLLRLPDGEEEAGRTVDLERLSFTTSLRTGSRDDSTVKLEGPVRATAREPRLRGGNPVAFPEGRFSLEVGLGEDMSFPGSWKLVLPYDRYPVGRPNVLTVEAQLVRCGVFPMSLFRELNAHAARAKEIHRDFFRGRFPKALAAAEAFLKEDRAKVLADAVRAEVEAFHREVPRYGQPFPAWKAAEVFGAEALPEDIGGRATLLDFWAVWCKPCVASMEHLISIRSRYPAEKLEVLGLTKPDRHQSIDDVGVFFREGYREAHGGLEINYPLVVLPDGSLHETLDIRAIPELYVLDSEGRIYWSHTGSGDRARLDRILEALLAR